MLDHQYFSDYYVEDEPEYVAMMLEGFQFNELVVDFIPVDPDAPDELEAGTVYLYDGEVLFAGADDNTYDLFDEDTVLGLLDGKCTRIDPEDAFSSDFEGKAYCQFTWSFADADLEGVAGQFTAEGPVQIGDEATLAITGGNGPFRTIVGSVLLYQVDVFGGNETDIVTTSRNPDLDIPASYDMEAYVWIDSSVLPDEMMA